MLTIPLLIGIVPIQIYLLWEEVNLFPTTETKSLAFLPLSAILPLLSRLTKLPAVNVPVTRVAKVFFNLFTIELNKVFLFPVALVS